MKRILPVATLFSVFSILNVVTILVLLSSAGIQVGSADPAGPPCVPGNVNGDGTLDLVDPIYLLQHLFQNGPAPIACAQPAGGGAIMGFVPVGFNGVNPNTTYRSLLGATAADDPAFASIVIPRDGVFRNLTVQSLLESEAATTTINLLVNGEATPLSIMTPPAGQSAVDMDEVCVSAGDLVVLEYVYPGGPDLLEVMQVSVSFD